MLGRSKWIAVVALVGCGDVATSVDAGNANGCPEPPEGGRWTWPAPVDPDREMLEDPGFEGPIGNTPLGWGHVEFGGAGYTAGAEKVLVHGGDQAYWYRRSGATGGTRIFTEPAFTLDHTYAVRLYARADAATRIMVAVMSTAAGTPEEQKTVAIGPDGWTEIELHVVYPKPTTGALWILPIDPEIRIILDYVSVLDVSPEPDYAPLPTSEILPTQIGIHVNKWGSHQAIPDVGEGMIRFHDTGTNWRNVEPDQDSFEFGRLDYLMSKVAAIPARPKVLFELGQTPAWAAIDPTLPGSYGPGAPSPPREPADFADYVDEIARAHGETITAWEMWNEYNQPEFWRGTHAQMVELTAAARDAIRAVDATDLVVSPSVTVSRIIDIGGFLDAGGGPEIDVIAFHAYFGLGPERLRPIIRNVRRMLAERGVSLPIWNTEGGLVCDALVMDCSMFDPKTTPTDAEIRGAIARALIIQRAEGIESFDYYMWDRYRPMDDGSSGEPDDWTVNASLIHEDFATPTTSGIAFRVVAGWLVGGRLAEGWRRADGTFVYRLERADGAGGYLAWNPD